MRAQVQFSPFFGDRLAVASASNFGILGNGRLFILNTDAQSGRIHPIQYAHFVRLSNVPRQYDTQDGLFDVCFSEFHEHQLVTAGGDGSVKMFDTTIPVRIISA